MSSTLPPLPPDPATERAVEAAAVLQSAPSFSPLYQQIKALITQSLQAGVWKPGQAIASEAEIAARYKVSPGTVRKAIEELAAEHLLVRRQGKGTFVATHAEERVRWRFLRLVPDADTQSGRDATAPPAPLERRLLDCRACRAPQDVGRALGLRTGETVIHARRLLLFDGRPVVLDDIWLHGGLFAGLDAARMAAWPGPLYALFETEFGVRMIRADERLRAVAASPEEADLLGVAAAAPLLSVERRSLTYGDEPVELRRGLYETSAHYYRNALN